MIKVYKILSKKPLTKCPSPASLRGRDLLSVILTKMVRTHGILFSLCFYGILSLHKGKLKHKKVSNVVWSLKRPLFIFYYIFD